MRDNLEIFIEKPYQKKVTTENLIALLESRLDTVIYRAKFASTVFSARQMINHGHVNVNKKELIYLVMLLKTLTLLKLEKNRRN